jgi:hypothetical protein
MLSRINKALAKAVDHVDIVGAGIVLAHIVNNIFMSPSTTLGFINDKTS